MKFLSIIAATLSFTSALAIPLVSPDFAHKNILVSRVLPGTSSSRHGGSRSSRPQYGKGSRGGDYVSSDEERYIQRLSTAPKYKKGYNYDRDHTPPPGDTGVYVDHSKRRVSLSYGNVMPYHADHVSYRDRAYPQEEGKSFRVASDERHESNRDNALSGLEKRPRVVLDEKRMAFLEYDNEATVMRAPAEESKYEAAMTKKASKYAKEYGYEVGMYDNRDSSTSHIRGRPLKGPRASGWDEPRYVTERSASPRANVVVARPGRSTSYGPPAPYGGSSGGQYYGGANVVTVQPKSSYDRRKNKRGDPITDIVEQQSEAASGNNNETADFNAQVELYLEAWYAAQSRASDLLWPFLDQITNGTNSSIIYDAAWAVHSQMLYTDDHVIGPFWHGMHSLDWNEDQRELGNSDDDTDMEMLAVNAVLLDLYQYAWNNGSEAVNKTGLLGDLAMLAEYLTPDDRSIMPADQKVVSMNDDEFADAYFLTYNETMTPNVTGYNITFQKQDVDDMRRRSPVHLPRQGEILRRGEKKLSPRDEDVAFERVDIRGLHPAPLPLQAANNEYFRLVHI